MSINCNIVNPDELSGETDIYYLIYQFLLEREDKKKFVEKLVTYLNKEERTKKFKDPIKTGKAICTIVSFYSEPNTKPFTDEYLKKDCDNKFAITVFLNTSGCYDSFESNKIKYYVPKKNFFDYLSKLVHEMNIYIDSTKIIPFYKDNYLEDFFDIENKSIEEISKKLQDKNKTNDLDSNSNLISEKQNLIQYIKKLIEIESDIYSLQKRYDFLLEQLYHYSYSDFIISASYSISKYYVEIDMLGNKIIEYDSSKPNKKSFFKKIEKPVFDCAKPLKPCLKKPNFFNKKKIELFNAQLLKQYELECKEYDIAKEKYNTLIQEYEKEVDCMEETANKEYESELSSINKKINDIKERIDAINKKIEEIKKDPKTFINKALEKDDKYIESKKIVYEMNYIVECLDNDINIREQLYSKNIIYGKYRNLIALSSFLDYLLSGRCDSLDGKEGAYNIYEQESRTDVIINKMDVIIDKLDEISKNQYYLYSELCEVNNSLHSIENLLLVNDLLQTVQIIELSKIIDNTDKIAYNSRVAAYYAEKIAHYTEALTYLKLLNG